MWSLFDTIDHCREHDIRMFGGGQFELDVGREHLHTIASLVYPDAPNDVAPTAYNDPDPSGDLPASPLASPANPQALSGGKGISRGYKTVHHRGCDRLAHCIQHGCSERSPTEGFNGASFLHTARA